jgi:hypothetical protein
VLERSQHNEHRSDLLDLATAAAVAGLTTEQFLNDVSLHKMPAPAQRWARDDKRRKWIPWTRWRRGAVMAAAARRKYSSLDAAADGPSTEAQHDGATVAEAANASAVGISV